MKLAVAIIMGLLAVGTVWGWRRAAAAKGVGTRRAFGTIAVTSGLLLAWFVVAVIAEGR